MQIPDDHSPTAVDPSLGKKGKEKGRKRGKGKVISKLCMGEERRRGS